MLTRTDAKARGLADLPPVEPDALIALIGLVNADPRPDKIDVGVGVFRDGAGNTPILKVMKEAEQRLLDTQVTKAYLGSAGDRRFAELLRPIVLGEHAADPRIVGVQTPGGCGALRLGFELIADANPNARVFLGTPSWPNHAPIIRAAGLETREYPYYERGQGVIRFEDMIAELSGAEPGDVALLHGCCHNPTGADLSEEQWGEVTRVVADRGLTPLVDIAYQGFGRGLDEDAVGLADDSRRLRRGHRRAKLRQEFQLLPRPRRLPIHQDRTPQASATAMGHVFQIAREMWSMPPDHGAACARIILDDPDLRGRWLVELEAMRDRINAVRQRIAAADPRLAYIGRQFGMFSMLPLSPEQVLKLRADHAIYMAESGRFNVVGMGDGEIERFTAAVIEAMDG